MTDPVWSVILLLSIGLIFVGYMIYYILKEANIEVQNGNKTTEGSHFKSSQELR